MSNLSPGLQEEYDRWLAQIGDDEYAGPNTLGILEVLKAHFLIAEFFKEIGSGLGGLGPRDLNLLHSCLYRQHASEVVPLCWTVWQRS